MLFTEYPFIDSESLVIVLKLDNILINEIRLSDIYRGKCFVRVILVGEMIKIWLAYLT